MRDSSKTNAHEMRTGALGFAAAPMTINETPSPQNEAYQIRGYARIARFQDSARHSIDCARGRAHVRALDTSLLISSFTSLQSSSIESMQRSRSAGIPQLDGGARNYVGLEQLFPRNQI